MNKKIFYSRGFSAVIMTNLISPFENPWTINAIAIAPFKVVKPEKRRKNEGKQGEKGG